MSRLILLSLTVAIACAQEPAPQQTIKVTTRLIETTVIVRDSHGPVTDLTADSFKLFDRGKEQKIRVFRIVKAEQAKAVAPLPPGLFSNRYGKAPARPPRSTMLLIDTLNTSLQDQMLARNQVLGMLKTMGIQDPTALFVLGENSRVLQDFTMDREQLTKAATAFRPESSHLLSMSEPQPMRGGRRMRAAANEDRAIESIDEFQVIGSFLAHVPGKKSVIWISNGFPAGALRNDTDRMRWLDRADVAIYPVYTRGLTVDMSGRERARNRGELDALNWVAEETGGRAFYGRNDLSGAIKEAIQDSDVTYTLGFYAQHEKPDGNFHPLKVTVDRSGVDIRHRAGYFDADLKGSPRTAPPGSPSDIGMTAAITREGLNFQIAVQIEFTDFRLEQVDAKWKGSAELRLVSRSAAGATLETVSKKLNFDMTDQAYQARRTDGLTLRLAIPGHDGTAAVQLAIVDRSGAAGVLSMTPPK